MAEDWIELKVGNRYQVSGGREHEGDFGICIKIRRGQFSRSWGLIAFDDNTEDWKRASHLNLVPHESSVGAATL